MSTLKDYIQQNFDNKSIVENFENFFDVDKILKNDSLTLLNLAKLLLLMTSLSSKKETLLPLLTSIESSFQSDYILSCEFMHIKSAGMLMKNNFSNSEGIVQVSEISLFLSGGDFLHKKIEILDETIIKNSEMYNNILDKLEKEKSDLKQSKIDLESFNDEKAAQIKELKQKLDEELSQLIKKNEEIIQLQKALDENKSKNDKELTQSQKQIKDITDLKDQEIAKLKEKIKSDQIKLNKQAENISLLQQENNELKRQLESAPSSQENDELKKQVNNMNLVYQENAQLKQQLENMNLLQQENEKLKNQMNNMNLVYQENTKLKTYCEDGEKEKGKMKNDIIMYQDKINVLEQKLNSDPYYAREIMSKTLYDFALKMMSENN
jgi:DNA repair exonuclease SbcCD ATPase subunit